MSTTGNLAEQYEADPDKFSGHCCTNRKDYGKKVEIFYFKPNGQWYMGFDWPDGYIPISHCPFCGVRLDTLRSAL